MRVLSLITCLATAAMVCAQSATTVVINIKTLTQKSSELTTVVSGINLVTAPLQGFRIGQGLSEIANLVYEYQTQMDNPPPVFNDADAVSIVGVLKTFVAVHQRLLNVLIGKRGVLTLIPFVEPIRVALVSLEAAVDSIAIALIDMIPTQAPEATQQFGMLSVTIKAAIQVYSR